MKFYILRGLLFSSGQGTIGVKKKTGRKEGSAAMSEEFGPNFVTVTDDEGNEIELEHLDTLEYNGSTYMAFFPAQFADAEEEPVDDEEYGLIILKVIQDNGEELLSTIDDEEELQSVYEQFMEFLFDDEEDEDK
jgi:uncharacterized protein YrzB (UPF0473 family)